MQRVYGPVKKRTSNKSHHASHRGVRRGRRHSRQDRITEQLRAGITPEHPHVGQALLTIVSGDRIVATQASERYGGGPIRQARRTYEPGGSQWDFTQ